MIDVEMKKTIKAMKEDGYTFKEIAKKLGLAESVVRHVCSK